jgi:2-phosphosulfolactate phosphatase
VNQFLAHWQVSEVDGPVIAIDVVRAFTTAAYAFGAGAKSIYLVEGVDEAHRLLDSNPTWLAMGENRGLRPERFALSNSPVHASLADLDGRTIVQRTSAGTRGAVAARRADPLLCASLVVASATSAYLQRVVPGIAPTYVITGRFADAPAMTGDEDFAVAEHIETIRRSLAPAAGTALPRNVSAADATHRVLTSADAAHTLTLGEGHVHPDDIRYCVDVDRFDFAMVTKRQDGLLVLNAVRP